MNTRTFYLLSIPILIILFLSGCSTGTSVRHISQYQDVLNNYNKVVILPVEVEINSIDSSGKGIRLYDYEYHMEELVRDKVIPEMRDKGFQVKFLSRKEIHDGNLYDAVTKLRMQYKEVANDLYKTTLMDKKDAFEIKRNFRDLASILRKATDSDLIMVVDFSGFGKTSNAVALEFVFAVLTKTYSSSADSGAVMMIGIIDAHNGDLLWSNVSPSQPMPSSRKTVEEKDRLDNKMLDKILKDVFKPFCYRCQANPR